MTASEDFQGHVDVLNRSVNLGYWFSLELYNALSTLVPDDSGDRTTLEGRVTGSSLLTADEQTETLGLITDYTDVVPTDGRDFVPAYYSNTREVVRSFVLLCTAYHDGTQTTIENLYLENVVDERYLMSDEDEYKIAARLVPFINAATDEIKTELDIVNT